MKNLILLFVLLCVYNFAHAVPWKNAADESIFGNKNTALDKFLSFDVGDGASNPKISVDVATKKFNLNKNAKVTGTVQATAGMILGNGTAADQSITVDRGGSNPVIKWSEADASYMFSNDGTLFKKFGSGTGGSEGGINILINPGFEDNLYNWSASSGVATISSSEVAVGAKSLAFDGAVNGDYVESTFSDNPTPQAVIDGYGCMADFLYKGGDNLTTVEILDGSANLLTSYTIPAAVTVWTKSPTLTFPCGTQNKIKFKATGDAALIYIDQVYLGGNKNMANLSQATVALNAYMAATSGCTPTKAGASFGDYTADTDCPDNTIVTNNVCTWSATNNDLPQINGTNCPEGRYLVRASFAPNVGTTNATYGARISDGASTGSPQSVTINGAVTSVPITLEAEFTYTSRKNSVQFKLEAYCSTGSCYIKNDNIAYGQLNWTVEYFPLNSVNAYLSDSTRPFFLDMNIGGANPSLGTSAVTSYTGITDAGLDLVNNIGVSQIACATTEESSGLTCTGNESVGFSSVFPKAGLVEVCFDFSHYQSAGSGIYGGAIFQIVKTANNGQTIAAEGRTRVESLTAGSGSTKALRVCGIFALSSAAKHTFRLFYEQYVSGTLAVNTLMADRGANNGQRDMRITARYIDEQLPMPNLMGDQLTMPGTTNIVEYTAFVGNGSGGICSSSPCTIENQWGGNGFASVSRSSAGQYTFTSSAVFSPSNYVDCECKSGNGSNLLGCMIYDTTLANSFKSDSSGVISTKVMSYIPNSAAYTDGYLRITCRGPRK